MSLSNPQIRKLKSLAQRLEPIVHVGKAGLTDSFLASVEEALDSHELIKIKFAAFKNEKESLATEIAARTHSELIWIVGHVAVLYRMQADPAKRRVLVLHQPAIQEQPPHLNPLPQTTGERRVIPSPLSHKGEGQGEGSPGLSVNDPLIQD